MHVLSFLVGLTIFTLNFFSIPLTAAGYNPVAAFGPAVLAVSSVSQQGPKELTQHPIGRSLLAKPLGLLVGTIFRSCSCCNNCYADLFSAPECYGIDYSCFSWQSHNYCRVKTRNSNYALDNSMMEDRFFLCYSWRNFCSIYLLLLDRTYNFPLNVSIIGLSFLSVGVLTVLYLFATQYTG